MPLEATQSLPDRQLQVLCNTAFDALYVIDDQRRYVHVNAAAAELLGAPAGEILRRRVEHFTPPELLPNLERLWNALQARGRLEGAYEFLRPDGNRAPTVFRATRVASGCHLVALRERPGAPECAADVPALTAREREVLRFVADGRSSPEIATELVVTTGTIKTHLRNIYRKLGASDRASAVAVGIRRGLIR